MSLCLVMSGILPSPGLHPSVTFPHGSLVNLDSDVLFGEVFVKGRTTKHGQDIDHQSKCFWFDFSIDFAGLKGHARHHSVQM